MATARAKATVEKDVGQAKVITISLKLVVKEGRRGQEKGGPNGVVGRVVEIITNPIAQRKRVLTEWRRNMARLQ